MANSKYAPAMAPANADSNNPKPPTPTLISLSPSKPELLIKSAIVPEAKSNTRNFVTAKGNSRAAMGLKDDHNGLMSSSCNPVGSIADGVDEAVVGIRGVAAPRFCLFSS